MESDIFENSENAKVGKDASEKTKAAPENTKIVTKEKKESGGNSLSVFLFWMIVPFAVPILIVAAALWFNYEYDVLGVKEKFPFVEIEKVSPEDRNLRGQVVDLATKILRLEQELENAREKQEAAENARKDAVEDSRAADTERRDDKELANARERKLLKEIDELKEKIETLEGTVQTLRN